MDLLESGLYENYYGIFKRIQKGLTVLIIFDARGSLESGR